jgi:hypothetical protein
MLVGSPEFDGVLSPARRVDPAVSRHDVALGRPACEQMEVVDPTADPGWDSMIEEFSKANAFHRSGWTQVLQRTYGHKPFYVRWSENGRDRALVPLMEVRSLFTGRRGVCLPFADACDALSGTKDSGLFAALCELGRSSGWKHIEFRGSSIIPREAPHSASYLQHWLDLSDGTEKVYARFAPSVRRALRKAKANGLTVEIGGSAELMRTYYRLHVLTRRRHGLPPQPRSFFENQHRYLLERGHGFVVIASARNRAIAGAVYYHMGKQALYKFGAADAAFSTVRPSNLVMAEGIRHLIEGGFQSLHFGRTSESNVGLARYKLGWGAIEETLHYYRYDLRGKKWTESSPGGYSETSELFRYMPLMVNRFLGKLLYPHLD